MNAEELIKQLKSIRCWVPLDSTAFTKINELIVRLGGKP